MPFSCNEVPIGTSCNAAVRGFVCFRCNNVFPDGDYRGVYQGHFTDGKAYHALKLYNPFKCQNCGLSIIYIIDECKSGGNEWIAEKHVLLSCKDGS